MPRNLDCGHTFCTRCIQKLESTASLRQGPRCPECRAVIRFNRRTVTSMPKNYKLLELIREQRGREGKTETETTMYPHPAACTAAMGAPVIPEERPHRGMMFMGNCFAPIIANMNELPDWMHHYRPLPLQPPVHRRSFEEELSQLRITTSASEDMESRNQTPIVFPPVHSPDVPQAAVPEPVDSGRAVTGPNGTLVCKFFQEGTCRYGPHCWFSHPVLNENKSLCRHWMKGQCRMGLNCNYRHGTQRCVPPIRPPRQRPMRDPAAPGPSGEGVTQSVRRSHPSTVVFVSSWGSTVHRSHQVSTAHHHWGNLPNQAGAPVTQFSSDSETFFDDFSTYQW